MAADRGVSRRGFLAGVAGGLMVPRVLAAQQAATRALPPLAAPSTVPTVTGRVEKLYKVAGSKEPNDLQFVPGDLYR